MTAAVMPGRVPESGLVAGEGIDEPRLAGGELPYRGLRLVGPPDLCDLCATS